MNFYPNEFKQSRVSPILKIGSKNKPENYCPISVIPVISQFFNCLLLINWAYSFKRTIFWALVNLRIGNCKSTSDAIDKFIKEVLSTFGNKVFAQVPLCGLSEAFDCVCHSYTLYIYKWNYIFTGYMVCNWSFLNCILPIKNQVLVNGD